MKSRCSEITLSPVTEVRASNVDRDDESAYFAVDTAEDFSDFPQLPPLHMVTSERSSGTSYRAANVVRMAEKKM